MRGFPPFPSRGDHQGAENHAPCASPGYIPGPFFSYLIKLVAVAPPSFRHEGRQWHAARRQTEHRRLRRRRGSPRSRSSRWVKVRCAPPPAHLRAHTTFGHAHQMSLSSGCAFIPMASRVNHVCFRLTILIDARGGVQEGVVHHGMMLFVAMAIRASRTTARSPATKGRRVLFQVGRPSGALQPLP